MLEYQIKLCSTFHNASLQTQPVLQLEDLSLAANCMNHPPTHPGGSQVHLVQGSYTFSILDFLYFSEDFFFFLQTSDGKNMLSSDYVYSYIGRYLPKDGRSRYCNSYTSITIKPSKPLSLNKKQYWEASLLTNKLVPISLVSANHQKE